MFKLICSAAVIVCALFVAPLWAQTPATPASSARAEDPAYSVFRWIKIQGDAQRKPAAEASKAKPKAEPAPVRRPEAQVAAPIPAAVRAQLSNAVPAPEVAPAEPSPPPVTETPIPVASSPVAPVTASVASAPAPAAVTPEPPEEPDPDLKVLSQAQPEFPRELRTVIAFGKVVVSFTVQTDGTVADATVVSYTNRKLGRPATDAVSKWVFEPVRTPRTVQVEIAFNAQ